MKNDFFEESEDEFENYENEYSVNIEMVVEEAEGLQVLTTYDSNGYVVDARVCSSEESSDIDKKVHLAKYIDHTLLKPDATPEQIMSLCREAKENHFASVCVNSCWVRLCAELLRGTNVKICSVVGFPLGAMIPEAKAFEAECAIENGASEIDMVINIGALKARDLRMVAKDIHGVVETAHESGALVKVIIETCLLTKEEKVIACLLSKTAHADFVKTSTGFSTGGATEEDVALMRKVVGDEIGVKASAGIRSREDAEKMIAAGANRLGTSSGMKIISG
jgi:deoxyribose-phosphate aldolase